MGGDMDGELPLDVIDLSDNDQLLLTQRIRKACMERGFFYLINHGVDLELVDKVLEQSKLFFDLPLQEKMKVLHDKNHRGYTPLAEERHNRLTSKQGDSREGYFIGWNVPEDHLLATKPLHGPNQWPSEDLLPEWRDTMERYFFRLLEVGHKVASLIALALDLEVDYFRHMFKAPTVALRPLHYIAEVSSPEEGRFGSGPHGDYGLLTFLATDENKGLQVCRDKDAEPKVWEDVLPKRGAFIVNLGDMLERWTNGQLSLCTDQLYIELSQMESIVTRICPMNVTHTHMFFGVRWPRSCGKFLTNGNQFALHLVLVISIPGALFFYVVSAFCPQVAFFFDPDYDTLIECLPSCCPETCPSKYPPITIGEYFVEKFKTRMIPPSPVEAKSDMIEA